MNKAQQDQDCLWKVQGWYQVGPVLDMWHLVAHEMGVFRRTHAHFGNVTRLRPDSN